ncbi:MAG: phosphoadenylyl-sulfate reductase [Betaproteobacteria bacterium]|nr:phosphoadenylyl-sulfate reductase [Betaproteobacteria bacterium]
MKNLSHREYREDGGHGEHRAQDFSVPSPDSVNSVSPVFDGPESLTTKVTRLRELLGRIERDYAPAAFANSFGAEDMVLTHLIATEFTGIEIFTLDTLRLNRETYALIDRARKHYGFRLKTYSPLFEMVEDLEQRQGRFSMYDSVENRKSCCYIRKVEPLNRALALKKAWLTGLRREQSAARRALGVSEFDAEHQATKFNPLIDWTAADVWSFLEFHDVPVNALHAKGYPSIGCEPCTRAVKPGEDPRAGRWWWEVEGAGGQQECGLHVKPLAFHPRGARA